MKKDGRSYRRDERHIEIPDVGMLYIHKDIHFTDGDCIGIVKGALRR